jgi:WD40 repeat protein
MAGAWQAHEGLANGVAFSGDGRVLATAGSDDAIRLWDVSFLRALKSSKKGNQDPALVICPRHKGNGKTDSDAHGCESGR